MLDAKMTILELMKENDTFGWLPYHVTWGKVELKNTRNIFSSFAMGARTVEIKLRRQPLTLDNSILRGDRQMYITAINDMDDPHFITVTAVLIDPVCCQVVRETRALNELNRLVSSETTTVTFPAWLTEKYVGHTQGNPQVIVDTMFVLITPKAVELDVGEIVTVNGKTYMVWVSHTLDDHKNEYEIAGTEEA